MRCASTAGEGVPSFWSEDIKLAVHSFDDDLTVVAYAARIGQQRKGRVDQFVQVDRDTVVDPDFWIGQLHLAQVLVEQGEIDLALAALNNVGKLGVNSKVIALRGYVLARMGRSEIAME